MMTLDEAEAVARSARIALAAHDPADPTRMAFVYLDDLATLPEEYSPAMAGKSVFTAQDDWFGTLSTECLYLMGITHDGEELMHVFTLDTMPGVAPKSVDGKPLQATGAMAFFMTLESKELRSVILLGVETRKPLFLERMIRYMIQNQDQPQDEASDEASDEAATLLPRRLLAENLFHLPRTLFTACSLLLLAKPEQLSEAPSDYESWKMAYPEKSAALDALAAQTLEAFKVILEGSVHE